MYKKLGSGQSGMAKVKIVYKPQKDPDKTNVSSIHLGNNKRQLLDLFIALTENKVVPDNDWMREDWEERQKSLGPWYRRLGIYGLSEET